MQTVNHTSTHARTHINHSVVGSKERECEIQPDCSRRPIVVRREPGVANCATERVKVCQGNSNCPLSNRKEKQGCAANAHRCAPSWTLAHREGRGWITTLRMRIYSTRSILCVGTSE